MSTENLDIFQSTSQINLEEPTNFRSISKITLIKEEPNKRQIIYHFWETIAVFFKTSALDILRAFIIQMLDD